MNTSRLGRQLIIGILCCGSFHQAVASDLLPSDLYGGYSAKPLVGNLYACANAGSICGNLFDAAAGTLSGSFSGSSILTNGGALTVASSASANFGALHLSGTDTLTDPSMSNSVIGEDISVFRDILTINSGNLLGTGFIQFQVSENGSAAATGAGGSTAGMELDIFSLTSAQYQYLPFTSNGASVLTSPFYNFQYGQPFNFAGQLTLNLYLGPGNGTATGDFSDTATITGIEVFDASMNPLTGWTISSQSGTTYGPNGVVPETGSAVLVFGGLSLVAGVKLRRHFTGNSET